MTRNKSYTPEFRAEAVRLVLDYSRPIRQVATELGVNDSTLRVWLQRAKAEGVLMADSANEDEQTENRILRKQLKEKSNELKLAQAENSFLKKAACFFAAETSDHHNGTK